MSDYLPLARKSRPRNFDEVVGQETASRTLKNALAAGKIHSAYLFTGPRGIGKTTLARILAKSLNCAKELGPNPCLECAPCLEIARSSCLDVLEMDAASNTGIDNVREAIIETVGLVPHRDRYKIFIIDEAHMLSNAAFNALLKTLEEPPPRVVFILATTEIGKIPRTVASRCQRFRFKPLSVEVLTRHLETLAKKEKISIEPEALNLLARAAEGAARDAVSLLDQCRSTITEGSLTESAVRDLLGLAPEDLLHGILESIAQGDKKELSRWIIRIEEDGIDPTQIAKDLRAFLHAIYRNLCGISESIGKRDAAIQKTLTPQSVSFLLRKLNLILEEIRSSDSPYLTLEVGLFGCLETPPDLSAWVQRLEQLESRLSSSNFPLAEKPSMPKTLPPQEENDSDESFPLEELSQEEPLKPQETPLIGGPAWIKVLETLQGEKPALASALKKAEVIEGSGNSWLLIFSISFDYSQAKRNVSLIESTLSKITGTSATLRLEEKKASMPEKIAPQPTESALSKAQKILGGRILKSSSKDENIS